MRFLPFVSLMLCLFAGCSPKVALVGNCSSDIHFWQPQLRDSVQTNKYRMEITKDGMNISGIWLVKYVDDSWRGTMVNEFGLKMFDFTCTANNCELINVMALIDKLYIKKTIARDVQFMLEIDNPAYQARRKANSSQSNDTLTIAYKKRKLLQQSATDEMTMHNKKHNLTYSFKKIED